MESHKVFFRDSSGNLQLEDFFKVQLSHSKDFFNQPSGGLKKRGARESIFTVVFFPVNSLGLQI